MSPALAAFPTASHGSLPPTIYPGTSAVSAPFQTHVDGGQFRTSPSSPITAAASGAFSTSGAATLPLHHAKSRFRVYRRPSFQLASAAGPYSGVDELQQQVAGHEDAIWTTRHHFVVRSSAPFGLRRQQPGEDRFSPPPTSSDDEVRDLLGAAAAGSDPSWTRGVSAPSMFRLRSPISGSSSLLCPRVPPRPSPVQPSKPLPPPSFQLGTSSSVIRRRATVDEMTRSADCAAKRDGLMAVMMLMMPSVRRPSLDFYKMQRTCLRRNYVHRNHAHNGGAGRQLKITRLKKRCALAMERSAVTNSFRSLSLTRNRRRGFSAPAGGSVAAVGRRAARAAQQPASTRRCTSCSSAAQAQSTAIVV